MPAPFISIVGTAPHPILYAWPRGPVRFIVAVDFGPYKVRDRHPILAPLNGPVVGRYGPIDWAQGPEARATSLSLAEYP